jgi:hypothetical protein
LQRRDADAAFTKPNYSLQVHAKLIWFFDCESLALPGAALMSSSVSTLQRLQPLLAPEHSYPAAGCIVRITFGQFSGRIASIVADYGAIACPFLLKLAPFGSSSFSPDANAALVLPPPAANSLTSPDATHCRLDLGMFALIRGAVAVGHRVELQQVLDRDTASKLLRVGCSVRLKDSERSGVVTSMSSSSATLQLRSPAQSDAAAVAHCSDVNVPHDQLVIRLKGTVLATRVCNSGTRAAAQAPLPSFEVQVQTETGDLWVEPFYVAVILKRRQMQAFNALAEMSSSATPSNSLRQACSRGDCSVLQVMRYKNISSVLSPRDKYAVGFAFHLR